MKVISIHLENFGSYQALDFEFPGDGLALIAGPTGSGKSTICDAIPWILFGKTAKNGPVNEVCAWPADKVTVGKCVVKFHEYPSVVVRTRGPKGNDLYIADQGQEIRGKDLNDTQKIINGMLGVDADLYLAGAYYNEFSPTAGFFTANAKTRRSICEQLVDLSLAVRLQTSLKEEDKKRRAEWTFLNSQASNLKYQIEFLSDFAATKERQAEVWQVQQDATINKTLRLHDDFEKNRKKIITKKCQSCGTVLAAPKEVTDDSKNPHIDKIEYLSSQKNPYVDEIKDKSQEVADLKFQLKNDKLIIDRLAEKLSDAEQLSEITNTYRAVSINHTISFLETETNRLLMDHFDAEIQVKFEVESADRLDVQIYRGENLASFTQLSKGQRQLLKLCFGVSVMQAVQNHHGIRFHQVFIDEATDGLDEQMKVKAFRLLEKLTQVYDDVFLVEHSEALKSLFTNKYSVELINGNSEIAKTQ